MIRAGKKSKNPIQKARHVYDSLGPEELMMVMQMCIESLNKQGYDLKDYDDRSYKALGFKVVRGKPFILGSKESANDTSDKDTD